MAYHAVTDDSSTSIAFTAFVSMLAHSTAALSSLTPKLVQQMIPSASSTLGLTHKSKSSSFVWYLNFEGSNYMTFLLIALTVLIPSL